MAEGLIFGYDKGLSSQDDTRLGEGFVVFMQNWVYDADDRDRIFKIQGRTSSGALPGAATAGTTWGFDHFQYDNDNSKIVMLTNFSFYEQAILQTGSNPPTLSGGWTQIKDKQAVQVAFPRNGTFFKTIPSGDNRYIAFSGDEDERPLIRDEDGDWHFVGLNKPIAPDLAAVTLAAVITRATGTPANPLTSDFGSVDYGGFGQLSPNRAADGDLATYCLKVLNTYPGTNPKRGGTDFKFSGGAIGAAQKLFIVLGISGLPPEGSAGGDFGGGEEACVTNLYIQVSTNGGGAWTTVYIGHGPLSKTTVQTDVAAGTTFSNLWVRVIFEYVGGTLSSQAYIYEIYCQTATTAGASFITAGTYYYAYTEVYQVTLASGKGIYTEGPPSDPKAIAISANTNYGVTLTFPTAQQSNQLSDGYKHDPTNKRLLYRKIYRSTSTGSWPDLGYIGDAAIDATTFVDSFNTNGITLGIPTINVVYADTAALNAANPAPDIFDAVFFRGAIVAIPAQDQYRIQWSLPGFPEYWPLPAQDLALLPSIRNDKLLGVAAVGEYLILFTRTRVLRLRELPFVNRPNFDIAKVEIDILSPNEGLAGSPMGFCYFQSQKGFSVCTWISDNGIWMTDGTLPSEGGLGIVKLTANLNWGKFVDPDQLLDARLSYDSVLQTVFFDYYDYEGNRRTLGLHTAPYHWVPSNQGHEVPKISGPHTLSAFNRIIAEESGGLWQLSLNLDDLVIYTERFSTAAAGRPIFSVMETGWLYPAGPQDEFNAAYGSLYHSDWGPAETCRLELLCRRDDTGVLHRGVKSGLSLAGSRPTNFYLNKSGPAFKLILSHNGLTTSLRRGNPQRAIGPCGITGDEMDALFGV